MTWWCILVYNYMWRKQNIMTVICIFWYIYLQKRWVLSFFFNVAAGIECTTLYTFYGKCLNQKKNESSRIWMTVIMFFSYILTNTVCFVWQLIFFRSRHCLQYRAWQINRTLSLSWWEIALKNTLRVGFERITYVNYDPKFKCDLNIYSSYFIKRHNQNHIHIVEF